MADYHLLSLCSGTPPLNDAGVTTCTTSSYHNLSYDSYGGQLGAQITSADAASTGQKYTIDALQTATIYPCLGTNLANTCNPSIVNGAPYSDVLLVSSYPQTATPLCSPSSGAPPLTVTCRDATSGAFFCWLPGNSTPVSTEQAGVGCAGSYYTTGTISVTSPGTITVIAAADGYNDSSRVSYTYANQALPYIPSPNILIIH